VCWPIISLYVFYNAWWWILKKPKHVVIYYAVKYTYIVVIHCSYFSTVVNIRQQDVPSKGIVTIVKGYYMLICNIKFHPNQWINMESMWKNLSMTVTEPIFIKLRFAWQLFIQNSHTEFNKNLTNCLVVWFQASVTK
jgi:hypothetical protein